MSRSIRKALSAAMIAICVSFSGSVLAQSWDFCTSRGGTLYECRVPDLGRWAWTSTVDGVTALGPYSSEEKVRKAFEAAGKQRWPCGFEIISIGSLDLQSSYMGYETQYRKLVVSRVLPGTLGSCYPPEQTTQMYSSFWKQRLYEIGGANVRCPAGFHNWVWEIGNPSYGPALCARDLSASVCKVGNPIDPHRRAKVETTIDYAHQTNPMLRLSRNFDTQGYRWTGRRASVLMPGYRWRTEADVSITVSPQVVTFRDIDGSPDHFVKSGAAYVPLLTAQGSLRATLDQAGNVTAWTYRSKSDHVYVFNFAGQLSRKINAAGRWVDYLSGGGWTWFDHLGRSIAFSSVSDVHRQATLPGGSRLDYFFTDPSLIDWDFDFEAPDLVLQSVTFNGAALWGLSYSEPQFAAGRPLPYLLTGLTDALGNRVGTYRYDESGYPVSTEGANGVNRFSVDTNVSCGQGGFGVTDPLGTRRWTCMGGRFGYALRPIYTAQPAGSGSAACNDALSYDSQGNTISRTDFNGSKTCYAYDLSRNLETKRAEGLSSGADCTFGLSSPPAGARLISTQWHPDWRLETKIAEPKKLTTIVYNGQGATCAPDTVLVDGKPPAVVCSRTEQATTDESGAAGFAATVTGTARTWSYTYTTYGRVLTATDPNGAVTTYTYHPDNDANLGRRGNVATITNAVGHVTRITAYNAHGQPTRIIDPNNLVTDLTYDLRMRLTRRKVGSETTSFVYDAAGQLIRVTLPDGARLTYTYDAAQRLTGIQDHKDNKVAYTLDAMGNRINEKLTDPGGVLVRNIQRSIDALNRVQHVTGR